MGHKLNVWMLGTKLPTSIISFNGRCLYDYTLLNDWGGDVTKQAAERGVTLVQISTLTVPELFGYHDFQQHICQQIYLHQQAMSSGELFYFYW